MVDPVQSEIARVAELRRQRELVAQHLAWLEREIAAATGGKPAPVMPLRPNRWFRARQNGLIPSISPHPVSA
jgi:hypothetical protein